MSLSSDIFFFFHSQSVVFGLGLVSVGSLLGLGPVVDVSGAGVVEEPSCLGVTDPLVDIDR